MKNASKILALIFLCQIGCQKKNEAPNILPNKGQSKDSISQKDIVLKKSVVLMDIMGDTVLDSLIITEVEGLTSVTVKNESYCEEVIRILPLYSKENKTLDPNIENVYFEANSIQTDEKGFRIKIRNTDYQPDCYYIDLYYKQDWYIKGAGMINTQDSVYIKYKKMNELLTNHFNDDQEFYMRSFLDFYFL